MAKRKATNTVAPAESELAAEPRVVQSDDQNPRNLATDYAADVEEFDSLPYIDNDLHLKNAERLIRAEMLTFEIKGNHPSMDSSQFDVKEEELVKSKPVKLNAIDITKFQLELQKDYKLNVQNAKAQFEYQKDRSINLELLGKYGAEAMKSYNDKLQTIVNNLESELTILETRIGEVNGKRKFEQMIGKRKLDAMREKRRDLYGNIVQVRMATTMLEQ